MTNTDAIWKCLNEADDHKSRWDTQQWAAWFVQLVDAVAAFDCASERSAEADLLADATTRAPERPAIEMPINEKWRLVMAVLGLTDAADLPNGKWDYEKLIEIATKSRAGHLRAEALEQEIADLTARLESREEAWTESLAIVRAEHKKQLAARAPELETLKRELADALRKRVTKREFREWEDIQGDATTLRSYIREFGETPTMTASNREHWKARAEAAEAKLAALGHKS